MCPLPRYDHSVSSFMKPNYFTWMLKAVVIYAKPNTRWRHGAHYKKMVLNKTILVLLHDFRSVISPIITPWSLPAHLQNSVLTFRICVVKMMRSSLDVAARSSEPIPSRLVHTRAFFFIDLARVTQCCQRWGFPRIDSQSPSNTRYTKCVARDCGAACKAMAPYIYIYIYIYIYPRSCNEPRAMTRATYDMARRGGPRIQNGSLGIRVNWPRAFFEAKHISLLYGNPVAYSHFPISHAVSMSLRR